MKDEATVQSKQHNTLNRTQLEEDIRQSAMITLEVWNLWSRTPRVLQ